jgi:putative ABC transport system permease protein
MLFEILPLIYVAKINDMKIFTLIIKELLYRKVSSFLILLTVITAGAVSVSIFTLSKASEDETRKIMREQGLNLYIFPKGTDLIDMFSVNSQNTFPEKYVDDLAASKTFNAVRHLTGILQVRMSGWKDPNGSFHPIILAGYKDEAMQRYLARQETMGFDVAKGTVQVGYFVARNIPENAPFSITGKDGKVFTFKIAKRFAEGRGILDQGVSFNLDDLQELLGTGDQINKIEALGCVCADGRIQNARKQVQAIFPDLEVTELASIADARENQRIMMNRYGSFIIPFVLIACLLITALLLYQNVRSGSREIALLKALGTSSSGIIMMILGKAVMLGLTGSVIGFFTGTWIAGYFGREIFSFTAQHIKPEWNLLVLGLIVFPLLWLLSGWIPAMIASQTDAAETLGKEQ